MNITESKTTHSVTLELTEWQVTLLFHISLLGMEEIQKRFEETANKVDPKSVKDAIHYKSQLEKCHEIASILNEINNKYGVAPS